MVNRMLAVRYKYMNGTQKKHENEYTMMNSIIAGIYSDKERRVNIKQYFIDIAEGQLYTTLYYPKKSAGKTVSTVTICKPYLEGFVYILSHKFLADLSSFLASKGYHVIVFHYRGFGDSSGDFSETTSEDCVEDTLSAYDAVRSFNSVEVKSSAAIGLFYGANIAFHSLVQSDRFQSGIMINPVLDIEQYLGYIYKLYYSRHFFTTSNKCLNKSQYMDHLRNGGFIDICGYPFTLAHENALKRMKIDSKLITTGKSVLYLECGRQNQWAGKELRHDHIIEYEHLRVGDNFLGNGLNDTIDTNMTDVFSKIYTWLQARD